MCQPASIDRASDCRPGTAFGVTKRAVTLGWQSNMDENDAGIIVVEPVAGNPVPGVGSSNVADIGSIAANPCTMISMKYTGFPGASVDATHPTAGCGGPAQEYGILYGYIFRQVTPANACESGLAEVYEFDETSGCPTPCPLAGRGTLLRYFGPGCPGMSGVPLYMYKWPKNHYTAIGILKSGDPACSVAPVPGNAFGYKFAVSYTNFADRHQPCRCANFNGGVYFPDLVAKLMG